MNEIARTNETDAEFARRLQEAEMGPRASIRPQFSGNSDNVPLISQDYHRINQIRSGSRPK